MNIFSPVSVFPSFSELPADIPLSVVIRVSCESRLLRGVVWGRNYHRYVGYTAIIPYMYVGDTRRRSNTIWCRDTLMLLDVELTQILLLLFICIAYNYSQGLLRDAFMMVSQTKLSSDHA